MKRDWDTMMEDVSSPPHFKMGGRKEEELSEREGKKKDTYTAAIGEPQTGNNALYL